MRTSIFTAVVLCAFAFGCTVTSTPTGGSSGSSGSSSGSSGSSSGSSGSSSGSSGSSGITETGSVPADLVGRWGGLTDSFEFRADGTVSRVMKNTSSTCVTDVLEHGTAVADGASLTISYTSGTITICNVTDPYQPRVENFTYTIETTDPDHPILRLENVPCEGNCSYGYDKR